MSKRKKELEYQTIDKTLIAAICLLSLLCKSIDANPALISSLFYLCGCIFFFAAIMISYKWKIIGLLVLPFHGAIGMFFMIYSSIGDNGIKLLGDLSIKGQNYVYTTISLFIIAIIYSIVLNLSNKLKEFKYGKTIGLALFFIAFLMTTLFTRIINYL